MVKARVHTDFYSYTIFYTSYSNCVGVQKYYEPVEGIFMTKCVSNLESLWRRLGEKSFSNQTE